MEIQASNWSDCQVDNTLDYRVNYEIRRMLLKCKKSNQYFGKLTKALYIATSEYVEEIKSLPVKRIAKIHIVYF